MKKLTLSMFAFTLLLILTLCLPSLASAQSSKSKSAGKKAAAKNAPVAKMRPRIVPGKPITSDRREQEESGEQAAPPSTGSMPEACETVGCIQYVNGVLKQAHNIPYCSGTQGVQVQKRGDKLIIVTTAGSGGRLSTYACGPNWHCVERWLLPDEH